MIARHGLSTDNIVAYTLISQEYQTVVMGVKELTEKIAKKAITVNNLAIENGKLVSTNGALDKYTLINARTKGIVGTAKAVILDRVEQNNKLVGYTVFTQYGTIVEMNVDDATTLANKRLISNGKIRHTENGDIVSAIGGNYPLRHIAIASAPKSELNASILYFSYVAEVDAKYVGVILTCDSAVEMSKIIDIVNKSNAALIAKVSKIGGQSTRKSSEMAKVCKSLAIARMGATGVYAIIDIDTFGKIISSGRTNFKDTINGMVVSALNYTNEEPDEAILVLNKSWDVIKDQTKGSVAAKDAHKFLAEVLNKFGNITIQ